MYIQGEPQAIVVLCFLTRLTRESDKGMDGVMVVEGVFDERKTNRKKKILDTILHFFGVDVLATTQL